MLNIFKKPILPSVLDDDIENDQSFDSAAQSSFHSTKNKSRRFKPFNYQSKKNSQISIKDLTKGKMIKLKL